MPVLWQIMVHVVFMQKTLQLFATVTNFEKRREKRSGLAGMDSISLTNLLGLKPEDGANRSANIHLLITGIDLIFCH